MVEKEAITNQHFTVSKDEWGDTGKSMKNALYVLWYAKDTFRAKTVKKI